MNRQYLIEKLGAIHGTQTVIDNLKEDCWIYFSNYFIYPCLKFNTSFHIFNSPHRMSLITHSHLPNKRCVFEFIYRVNRPE